MKNGLFWVLLILSLSVRSQVVEMKLMWEEAKPLTWADFQGTPNPNNPFQANTNSGISYSWSFKASGDEVTFASEVFCFFLPKGSWVRPGKASTNLLAHEQLHFDITELHARKLRKELENFTAVGSKDMKKLLGDIYKKIDAERKLMQERYDRETDHSQKEKVQEEWQQKIEAELAALEEFSS